MKSVVCVTVLTAVLATSAMDLVPDTATAPALAPVDTTVDPVQPDMAIAPAPAVVDTMVRAPVECRAGWPVCACARLLRACVDGGAACHSGADRACAQNPEPAAGYQHYGACARVCVCVCVRACARACVRVHAHAYSVRLCVCV
jgi:hypothetical protein